MSVANAKSTLPSDSNSVMIIERRDWSAVPPRSVDKWKTEKITNIVMTTTKTDTCKNREECIVRVQEIQKKDMEEGHPDIKYNFLVAGDGNIYEGRGWNVSTKVSTKDGDKNSYLDGNCLYIGFIGPQDMTPSTDMFTALSGISSVGVDNNMIGRAVKIIRIEGDQQQVYDLDLDEAFEDEKEMAKKHKQVIGSGQ